MLRMLTKVWGSGNGEKTTDTDKPLYMTGLMPSRARIVVSKKQKWNALSK